MATVDNRPVLLTRRELNMIKGEIRTLRERVDTLEKARPPKRVSPDGHEYREYVAAQARLRKRKARDTNGSR